MDIVRAILGSILIGLVLTLYLPIACMITLVVNGFYVLCKACVLVFGVVIIALTLIVHVCTALFRTRHKHASS